MVAEIFEHFQPPSKKFLATPLNIISVPKTDITFFTMAEVW